MASTAPAKSQPLHNFDLLHLKWNKDGSSNGNHHQRRRSVNSPSRRPNLSPASPLRNSPLRDSSYGQSPLRDTPPPVYYTVKQSPIRGKSLSKYPIRHNSESKTSGRSKGYVTAHRKNQSKRKLPDFDALRSGGKVNSSNSKLGIDKPVKKLKALQVDGVGIKRSSKIKFKNPSKSKPEEENMQEDVLKVDCSDESDEAEEVREEGKNNNNNNIGVDEEAKTWNLRPRKPMCKNVVIGGGGLKNSVSATPESKRNLKDKIGENEGNGGEKEKRKLSINISLTKEEIEEDFFGWTGAKPPKRPKKRPKTVQKQLDFVFPALWLVSITPDSYKVSENYMKG